jgi:outer membrane protein assembly factor BamB
MEAGIDSAEVRAPSRREVAPRRMLRVAAAVLACALLGACDDGVSHASLPRAAGGAVVTGTETAPAKAAGARTAGASAAGSELLNWPEFGLNPERSDATAEATGITAQNVRRLRRIRISLPGTVDSSPIYLHDVRIHGETVDAVIVTTTYGKTLAIDGSSGKILWTFTPPGYSSWAGTPQITTATPLADPDRRFVYAASPNGLIHKLSLDTGREDGAGSWPVRIALDPVRQKITPALNIDGSYVLAATGGYDGDIPPYQGHVVAIERSSGRIRAIFNTLCANRRRLIEPSTCSASDSAILSRSGAVVEPGDGRILIDTGNGPWNGRTNFGDSVIELTMPSLKLRQVYTPPDQEKLNDDDLDLGSSAPALLGENRVVLGGKDGILRVLALSRLDGKAPPGRGRYHERLGGAVQQLPLPGGGQLFTTPAVWRGDGRTEVFIGDENATAAYALRRGRLHLLWENGTPGTSPVLAGGLVYVYEPDGGGIEVYRPTSSRPIAELPGLPGHWNSPIVVDGHVLESEGDANDHALNGTLDLFSVR